MSWQSGVPRLHLYTGSPFLSLAIAAYRYWYLLLPIWNSHIVVYRYWYVLLPILKFQIALSLGLQVLVKT